MGIPVMILGESGTGKSSSLRNFPDDELKIINVAGKPLPFKNKMEMVNTDSYSIVKKEMRNTDKKSIVIDDSQYLMANEFMRRATEKGYDKFTEIAQNMWDLVNSVKQLPDDVIVYFLTHLERDQNGNEKVKTIGKLLDEKITLEGMFTIVLKTNVNDGQYSFLTANSGHDTVKSPMGLFPTMVIDNDLKYDDEKVRDYYELGGFTLTPEEMQEIDEAAKKDDIPIADGKKKRGGRSAKKEEATSGSDEDVAGDSQQEQGVAESAAEGAKATRKRRTRTAVKHPDGETPEGGPVTDPVEMQKEIPFDGSESEEKPARKSRKKRDGDGAEAEKEPEATTTTRRRRRVKTE